MNADDDATLTRSEEELRIVTERRVVGRVRLRRRIVTEEVQVTVTLRREELEIVHEDADGVESIGDLDDDPISEQVTELILHAEEPVIGTRLVPVERVRVHRDVVREERQVGAALRAERVELVEQPAAGQ